MYFSAYWFSYVR